MWILWLAGGYLLGKYGSKAYASIHGATSDTTSLRRSWDVLVLAQDFRGGHSWAMCGPVEASSEQEAANQAARQYFGSMTVAKHAMTQSWTTDDGTVFQVRS